MQKIAPVTTIAEARKHLGIMLADNGLQTVCEQICTALNVFNANVSIPSHDVWVAGPGGPHWLCDEEIIGLVNILNKGV